MCRLVALALVALTIPARAHPPDGEEPRPRRPLASAPHPWRPPEAAPRQERRDPIPSFPEVTLTFLLTSDLDGRFADVRCAAGGDGPDLSTLVGVVDAERARLAKAGQPPPILLDAGDLLGTAAVTRYLLGEPGNGPETLASLLRRLDLDLITLGNEDLAHPPEHLRRVLSAGQLHYAAANVACDPAVSPLCPHLRGDVSERGYAIIVRAGLRVAVVPVTRDDAPLLVNRAYVAGLTFSEPLATARAAVRRARLEDRADLVVVLAHVNDGASVPRRALQLARRATEADLVLVNGFGAEQGGYDIREIRFSPGNGTRPPVLGQGGASAPPLRISADMVHYAGRFRPRSFTAAPLPPAAPDPPVLATLAAVRRDYCAAWATPLAAVEGALDAEELLSYVLQVMRFETRTELAVINREAMALPTWPPLSGAITRDLLFHALPYGGHLVRFSLRGDKLRRWLAATFGPAEALVPSALRFAGVERDGASFKINGRALDEGRTYRVVTTRFLALGGDRFLEQLPDGVAFDDLPMDGLPPDATLRDLLERWLAGRPSGGRGVSLGDFPALYDALVWGLSADVGLRYEQTAVDNAPAYTESQLKRDAFFGFTVTSLLRAEAQSRLHELTTMLDLAYAQAQVADGDLGEKKDLAVVETTYAWLALRNAVADESPFVPVPSSKLRLETELTTGEGAPFHHALLTGVLGIKWLFTDKVTLSVGYGLGGELLDPGNTLSHGLDVTFEVQKLTLFDILEAPSTLRTRVDLSYADTGGTDVLRGLLGAELAFAIAGPLALTVGFDGFVFKEGAREAAFAADVTAGLKLLFGTHVQTF
ncbi:MAG: hypothetical protein AMXMBFR64_45980 [Myxococcales bacterium]